MEDNANGKVPEDVISKTSSFKKSNDYRIIRWIRRLSIIHLCVIIATLTGVGFLALFTWKVRAEYPLLWAKRSIGIYKEWEDIYGLFIIYRTDIIVDQSGIESVICKVLTQFKNDKKDTLLTINAIELEFYTESVGWDNINAFHKNSMFEFSRWQKQPMLLWSSGKIEIAEKIGYSMFLTSGSMCGCYTIVIPVDYFVKSDKIIIRLWANHEDIKPVEQKTE